MGIFSRRRKTVLHINTSIDTSDILLPDNHLNELLPKPNIKIETPHLDQKDLKFDFDIPLINFKIDHYKKLKDTSLAIANPTLFGHLNTEFANATGNYDYGNSTFTYNDLTYDLTNNNDVLLVQNILNLYGTGLKINGLMDRNTIKALENFTRNNSGFKFKNTILKNDDQSLSNVSTPAESRVKLLPPLINIDLTAPADAVLQTVNTSLGLNSPEVQENVVIGTIKAKKQTADNYRRLLSPKGKSLNDFLYRSQLYKMSDLEIIDHYNWLQSIPQNTAQFTTPNIAWSWPTEIRQLLGYYTNEERDYAARLNELRSNTFFRDVMPNFGKEAAWYNPGAEFEAFRATATYLPYAMAAALTLPIGGGESIISNAISKGANFFKSKIPLNFNKPLNFNNSYLTYVVDPIKEGSKYTGKLIYDSGKYMINHPIETFVLPQVTNETLDAVNNTLNDYGYGLSDDDLNHVKLFTNFMINPAMAAKGRSLFTPNAVTTNSGFFSKYLNNALTNNGRGITLTGNSFSDYLRIYAPAGIMGFGTAEGINLLTNGEGIGNKLTENENIAQAIDYAINPIIYTTIGRSNKWISRPLNNANLLAEGAPNPVQAISNIGKGIKRVGWKNFLFSDDIMPGRIYTGTAPVTQRQIETGTYRTIASKTEIDPSKSFLADVAAHRNLQIGQEVGNAGKVVGKFSYGHVDNNASTELVIAQKMTQNSSRYGKGSLAYLIKLNGSTDLPEGTISVKRNPDGTFTQVNSKDAALVGGRKDILLDNGYFFNQNGHLTTFHLDPATNKLYEVTFDLWGTGSAGSGIVSKIADSSNHPIISYLVKEINPLTYRPFVRSATIQRYKTPKTKEMIKLLSGKITEDDLILPKENVKILREKVQLDKEKAVNIQLEYINALLNE